MPPAEPSRPSAPTPGSLTPTPRITLVVAAIFGALAAWIVYTSAGALDLVAPQVPWTAPAALLITGMLVGGLAYTTHQRIQVRRERIDPQRAVALLVLGKAAALAGALVAGGYLTYAVLFVSRLEAAAPRERVLRSAVAMLIGVGICAAGLLLERACRVPGHGDGDQDDTGTEESAYEPS